VRRVTGLVVLALTGAFPAAAGAESHFVSVPGKYFSPGTVTAVVGDEVTWRNSDLEEHDVRAADGSFESGRLGRFGGFTVRFDGARTVPYLCSIHPFMRGQIDVVAAVLRGPSGAALDGESVRLEGRAAPGATVTLERLEGTWHGVANAVAGSDGAFGFTVVAAAGAAYRAVTDAGASAPVALAVTARLDARIAVRGARVSVRTVPAQPGLVAVLQRYSRERYMWRRVAHARVDRRGRADFRVRARGRFRVVLSRRLRGAPLAVTPPRPAPSTPRFARPPEVTHAQSPKLRHGR
jgi:plastocyanin